MRWPNKALLQSSALSGTLALPVIRTEPPRIRPCTPTKVPSVMIREGTEVRTVRIPFNSPMTTPNPRAQQMPTKVGRPK